MKGKKILLAYVLPWASTAAVTLMPASGYCSPTEESISPASNAIGSLIAIQNNAWVLLAFVLVVLMQPGFAFLEAGLIRSTNTISVLFKNTIDMCIGGILFFLFGYSLMFNVAPEPFAFVGTLSVGWMGYDAGDNGVIPEVHFLFQFAFAATAATICSGAVAGRMRLSAYFFAAAALSVVIYPIGGYWAWSPGGWLNALGFHDFAGSSVVHAVGGFAGLAGALVLGPRICRFEREDDRLKSAARTPIQTVADATMFRQSVNGPHSLALATLGMFFLWIGWFGFNGGSELALADESREHLSAVGRILVNTLLAGCAGGAVATIMSALVNSLILVRLNQDLKLSLDLEHTLNGVLGGLVAVTACCDLIPDPIFALLIGAVAGVIVVLVVSAFDTQFRIDDPVGAFAVHGACGVFGTLACALFGKSLLIQLLGAVSLSAWSFTVSFCLFYILNLAHKLRVSEHDEILGLDRSYHGKSAYHIE